MSENPTRKRKASAPAAATTAAGSGSASGNLVKEPVPELKRARKSEYGIADDISDEDLSDIMSAIGSPAMTPIPQSGSRRLLFHNAKITANSKLEEQTWMVINGTKVEVCFWCSVCMCVCILWWYFVCCS
jgi:hypothetical protein